MKRKGEDTSRPASTASATDLIAEGEAHQLGGRLREAAECFAMAIDIAAEAAGGTPLAEALRRLGIVHHLRGETTTGVHYCQQSREVALAASDSVRAAEAMMALANMACEQGKMDDARELYRAALELAPGIPSLAARIEQNLGIVESVQGNLAAALEHYRRALHAHETTHNVLGRARAYHNIGMICADQKEWDAANRAYAQAASLARQGGDYHLSGLCLLNRAEIDMAYERYDAVRTQAEAALAIFDRLGARADMAAAFRMQGTALRFLKRKALAESRLRSALEIATTAGVPLTEAESCRDIAYLFAETGRRSEALGFMDRAVTLFRQLGATLDVVDLSVRRTELLAA